MKKYHVKHPCIGNGEQYMISLSYIYCKEYLAIPATSVPAELAFSVAGHIVNQKRSCLLAENVNKLVFLAENLK